MDNWDRAIRVATDERSGFTRVWQAGDSQMDGMRLRGGRTMSNASAGVGDATDLLLNSSINTGGVNQRDQVLLETLYAKFWAAAKIVDLKPDDAFAGGVVWNDDDQDVIDQVQEEMERLDVMRKALAAVKAARIYGTAILILAPRSGNFMEPILEDEDGSLLVDEGDVSHLLIVDRFRLEDYETEGNPANPMFGQIVTYRWNFVQPHGRLILPDAEMRTYIDVHHSRVLRFDGVPPITSDGWEVTGDDRWGQSILVRALEDILQDKILCAAMSELVKRASVPIIKIPNLKQMVGRGKRLKSGEMSPDDYATYISERMTMSNLMFLDHEDEPGKLELHTTGVMDVVKQQAERMAMIEGIPITRFTGQSATGLSATGEGDAQDWRIEVEAYRKKSIDKQVSRLLRIVARSAGVGEPPDWKWGRLGEATAEETALVAKTYAETVVALLTANTIDEGEARRLMNESELFNLEEEWEPPPLQAELIPPPPMPGGGKVKGTPSKPGRPTKFSQSTSKPKR